MSTTLKHLPRALLAGAILIGLMGCATEDSNNGDPKNTHIKADMGYVDISDMPETSSKVNKIRLSALSEAATSLGARGALAWRAEHIDQTLSQESTYLDEVFNFNQLLLKHNVLPPVIAQADNELNLDSDDTIRSSNKVYQIVSPARFVTAPPTWRNYLWMTYPKPKMPDHSLLPNTQDEAKIWDHYLEAGWKNGLQQADDIFAANLSRLKRDYMGMALYRELLAKNMISAPQVAKASLGITGNEKEIRINDEVMRITAHSALNPNSEHWNPVMTKDSDTFK